jgi:hypothetical protein
MVKETDLQISHGDIHEVMRYDSEVTDIWHYGYTDLWIYGVMDLWIYEIILMDVLVERVNGFRDWRDAYSIWKWI